METVESGGAKYQTPGGPEGMLSPEAGAVPVIPLPGTEGLETIIEAPQPAANVYVSNDPILRVLRSKLNWMMNEYGGSFKEDAAPGENGLAIFRLAADHITQRVSKWSARDGGLLSMKGGPGESDDYALVTVDVVVGDPKRPTIGIDAAYHAANTAAEDPEAIRDTLHDLLDKGWKAAELAFDKAVKEFRNNPEHLPWQPQPTPPFPPELGFGARPVVPFNILKIQGDLEAITRRLYRLGQAKEDSSLINELTSVDADFYLYQTERRAVVRERKIHEGNITDGIRRLQAAYSEVRGILMYSVTIRDQSGRETELYDYLVGFDEHFPEEAPLAERLKAFERDVKDGLRAQLFPPFEPLRALVSPMFLGYLGHEAVGGHAMSAEEIAKHGFTYFRAGRRKILPEFMQFINDPTIPCANGSYLFDAELVRGARTVLIEDGGPRVYLHNLRTAGQFKVAPPGNSLIDYNLLYKSLFNDDSVMPEPRTANLIITSKDPSRILPRGDLFRKLVGDARDAGEDAVLVIERAANGETDAKGTIVLENLFGYIVDPHNPERKNWKPFISSYFIGSPLTVLKHAVAFSEETQTVLTDCETDSGFVSTSFTAPYAYFDEIELHPKGEDPEEKRRLKQQLTDEDEDEPSAD